MEKILKRKQNELKTFYYEGDNKIMGTHNGISGDVSGILGDVSGISGDVNRIWGDINLCKITQEEREKGIYIEDLISEE